MMRERNLTLYFYPKGRRKEMNSENEQIKRAKELAEEYAYVDGSHHKQYALVQIAKLLGSNVKFDDVGMPD